MSETDPINLTRKEPSLPVKSTIDERIQNFLTESSTPTTILIDDKGKVKENQTIELGGFTKGDKLFSIIGFEKDGQRFVNVIEAPLEP